MTNKEYIVTVEIVKNEKVVKTERASFGSFFSAKYEFHEIEKYYKKLGYQLDDDTNDYTEEMVGTNDFFNNATNDSQTVRIFLDTKVKED